MKVTITPIISDRKAFKAFRRVAPATTRLEAMLSSVRLSEELNRGIILGLCEGTGKNKVVPGDDDWFQYNAYLGVIDQGRLDDNRYLLGLIATTLRHALPSVPFNERGDLTSMQKEITEWERDACGAT